MKTNFTRIPALLIAAILFYASCKQAAVNPAANTTDYKALSSQVGLSLYKSLTGSYGGTNINNGIKPPANVSAAANRNFAAAGVNLLCGFTADTGYNTKATAGDTAKTFFGHIHFVYLCDNNIVDGYTVKDTVVNTEDNITQAPNNAIFFHNNYSVGQDFTVKALDQTYQLVSLNGTIAASITQTSRSGLASPAVAESVISNYVLTGLTISITNGIADITSGQATFLLRESNSAVINPPGFAGFFSGIILFLGNHKAKLTFFDSNSNKFTFSVDLLTGVATPI
jgi:hypothetical protein